MIHWCVVMMHEGEKRITSETTMHISGSINKTIILS